MNHDKIIDKVRIRYLEYLGLFRLLSSPKTKEILNSARQEDIELLDVLIEGNKFDAVKILIKRLSLNNYYTMTTGDLRVLAKKLGVEEYKTLHHEGLIKKILEIKNVGKNRSTS